MSDPIRLGFAGTDPNADIDEIWDLVTGDGAMPDGRAVGSLAQYIENNQVANVLDFVDDAVIPGTVAGTLDAAGAVQAAFDTGRRVRFPRGTIRVDTEIDYSTTAVEAGGIVIEGEGMQHTVIDYRGGAGSYAFRVQSTVDNRFQLGVTVRNLSITTLRGGIYLKGLWLGKLENVRVANGDGDGIRIESLLVDADSPSSITLDRCQIKNMGGIGLNITGAAAAASISSIRILGGRIEDCRGGGLSWQGQILDVRGLSIAVCDEFAFRVAYNDIHSRMLRVDGLYLENNECDFDIQSLLTGSIEHVQVIHNLPETYPCPVAWKIGAWAIDDDGNSSFGVGDDPAGRVRNLVVKGIEVQVSSGYNPHTFFRIQAFSAGRGVESLKFSDIDWTTFDGTGQTRYQIVDADGNAATATESVDTHVAYPSTTFTMPAGTVTVAAGENYIEIPVAFAEYEAIRLATVVSGVIITGVQNRFREDGKRFVLMNQTGSDITINHLDAGPVGQPTEDRIACPGAVNLTIPNFSLFELRWSAASEFWWVEEV